MTVKKKKWKPWVQERKSYESAGVLRKNNKPICPGAEFNKLYLLFLKNQVKHS
jgi:hypothetical protein